MRVGKLRYDSLCGRVELRLVMGGTGHSARMSDVRDLQRQRRDLRRAKARTQERSPE